MTGFVRSNGRAIGSASSGANELADPSAQALFNFLWNKDTSLTVFPSRGASSAADWTANKQLSLPDFRGYALSGLDDMGNSAAGRLGSYFANATILGSAGGAPSFQIAPANLPPYTPSGAVPLSMSGRHGSNRCPRRSFGGANQAGTTAGVGNNNT